VGMPFLLYTCSYIGFAGYVSTSISRYAVIVSGTMYKKLNQLKSNALK
jgi:hypothetical protein